MHSETHRSNPPNYGAKEQRKPLFIKDLRQLALALNLWNFCFQLGNEGTNLGEVDGDEHWMGRARVLERSDGKAHITIAWPL